MKDQSLIDLADRNNLGGGGPPPSMGFIGYPSVPPLPQMPEVPANKPFNYPPPYGGGGSAAAPLPHPGITAPQPFSYNIPPNIPHPSDEVKDLNTHFINVSMNCFFMANK